jgi:DNA-binding NarL/FixJ family response regulator
LLLQARPAWQVVAEASDGSEAVQKAEELKPDLILLDIGFPNLNGIEAARQIRQRSPNSKIIFLSQNSELDIVRAALGAGALGYVRKIDARRELLPAVDAVFRGEQFISSSNGSKLTDTWKAKASISPWNSSVASLELSQLSFRNSKFCHATIQAHHNLRKYPHDRFVNIFQSEKMDAHLRAEFLLIGWPARVAGHIATLHRLPNALFFEERN